MAFNPDYFSWVDNSGGLLRPKFGVYKTADSAADVDTAGYFPVGYKFRIGDLIYRVTVTNLGAANEALSTAGWHVVKDVSKTQVDVTDVTALTMTDTD